MNVSKFARDIQQIAQQMLDEDKAGINPLRHAGLCFNFTERLENAFDYSNCEASAPYDLMRYCIGWTNYEGLGAPEHFNEARREVCRIICKTSHRTLRRWAAVAIEEEIRSMYNRPALKVFKHIKPDLTN